jgi:hypothetical protein
MTFEDEFAAAVRRQAKIATQAATTESADVNKHRRAKIMRGNGFLRVIVGGKSGAYDLGPKDDPDGVFVTLRDPK